MIAYSNLYKLTANPNFNYEFEVLNELKDLTSRTDTNCLYHTRFCFEMDNDSLDDQIAIIKQIQDNLVRVVYSGSKSYHCIIEFDPKYEDQCRTYYKRIWDCLDRNLFKGKCDRQCSNPSRLTRTPGVIRASTGREQTLLYNYPGNYYKDAEKIVSLVMSNEIAQRIKTSLNAKPVYRNNNVDCSKWDVVKRYLETPFPNRTGNGHSSSWLYAALQTTKKYGDNATQQMIIAKAKREGWSDTEISHKLK